MQNKKHEVTDWIRSGMDYNEGISLLISITQKQFYSSQFSGREQSLADKLAYEICKAAKVADHVTWKDFIRDTKVVNVETFTLPEEFDPSVIDCLLKVDFNELDSDQALALVVGLKIEPVPQTLDGMKDALLIFMNSLKVPDEDEANLSTEENAGAKLPEVILGEETMPIITGPEAPAIAVVETIATKPLEEYPVVIRRVIMEYAELFQERSQLHTVMGRLPESNTDSVCAKRKELFDLIKTISDRLELLYNTQEAFTKEGSIPDESVLFPPADKPEVEHSIDTTLMDEDALKKQKKNLQSGNSKDKTFLDFQSKESQGSKNPMPNGPKRTKIEMRIAERNKKIEEIEVLLLNHAGKE